MEIVIIIECGNTFVLKTYHALEFIVYIIKKLTYCLYGSKYSLPLQLLKQKETKMMCIQILLCGLIIILLGSPMGSESRM